MNTSVRHRPKSFTVFAAAFIAGAAAAVGVNRFLDVHLAQRKPQVECEPIFVALRSLPQGAPVTVWDVALKDWPKAMLPTSALRAHDSFEGFVLRHAIREGQPLLSLQLVRGDVRDGLPRSAVAGESFTSPLPADAAAAPPVSTQSDLWTPSGTAGQQPAAAPQQVATAKPVVDQPAPTTTDIAATEMQPFVAPVPAEPTPTQPTPAAATPTEATPQPQTAAHAPTAVEETVAESQPKPPMAPSPVAVSPPAKARPTPAGAAQDMSEAVATDVASMPSVMAPAGKAGSTASRPSSGEAARYLVVPERIALQADTSFATPRPQPPGPPTEGPQAPEATAQRGKQPSANAGPQTMRRTPQPRSPQARGQQPQQQQSRDGRQPSVASPQRPWGGLFPNMAAGIEAMSSPRQKGRSDSSQPQTGTAQPTRR